MSMRTETNGNREVPRSEDQTWDMLRKAARKAGRANPGLAEKLRALAAEIEEVGDGFEWGTDVHHETVDPDARADELWGISDALDDIDEGAAYEVAALAATVAHPLNSPYIYGEQAKFPEGVEEGDTFIIYVDPVDGAAYSAVQLVDDENPDENADEEAHIAEAEHAASLGGRTVVVRVVAVCGFDDPEDDDDDR